MTNFTLRPLTPDDGPAIAALGEQSPETGAVAFHSQFHDDPYRALLALQPTTLGVVAEAPDHEGLVGLALIYTGECNYEERVCPFAYFYSLSVHPNYRRHGLGSQLATWRMEKVKALFGDQAVMVSGIQPGNIGSVRTAQKWSQKQFTVSQAGIAKVRTKPPQPRPGWEVRPAQEAEFAEIAEKQNRFYQGYNFYPSQTATSLAEWRARQPLGFQLHEYYVLVDAQRNILAGLGITDEGRLISSHLIRMAWPIRLGNLFLKIVPPDGIVKRLPVEYFWFEPDQLQAGSFLWESLRWLWRERGTMLMTFFDTRSPLAQAIRLPRLMPAQRGSLMVRGPVPPREERLVYQFI